MFANDHTFVTAKPRRRRYWLLAAGVPLLVIALAGVGYLGWINSGLNRAIAEADRLDPRWQLEDIQADRATPPAGENAADTVIAVQRLQPRGVWLGEQFDPHNDPPPQHLLTDDQIAAVRAALRPAGPALATARSLIDTPRGRHPVVYAPSWIGTLLPTLQGTRDAVELLRWDVYDKTQSGDVDGAVRSAHAAFHAGGSLGDEPNVFAQIVRASCQMTAVNLLERALAQGEPAEALLVAFQARLEAAEPERLYLCALRGDRAGHHILFENLRNGTVPFTTLSASLGGLPGFEDWLAQVPGSLAVQQTLCLQFLTGLVEVAKRPPEEWAGPLAEHEARAKELPGLLQVVVGPHVRIAGSFRRNHALLRCAVVAIAAERFRRAHGRWPATPEELVKVGFLKAVPTDPFAAGQPIRFARPGDGLIVYSVGPDGVDDGGNLAKNPARAGFDFGVRLWDVAARRQPPRLPKAEAGADANGPPGGPGAPAP